MNKIYRRLWSTARQCWVVASELTAPRGKAASTTAAASAVLLAALLPDVGLQVAHATIYDSCQDPKQIIVNCVPYRGHDDRGISTVGSASGWFLMLGAGSYIKGNHSALFGSGSSSTGNYNAVFGNEAHAYVGYSTVLGAKAKSDGLGTVSVGHDSLSNGLNSIAMGSGAKTAVGGGHSRIAIGGNAEAGSPGWTGGMAVGGYARSTFDGVALGYGAQATATGSIALGAHSVADQSNTVSVGKLNGERRIVNVKDGNLGSSSTDAVNGRQLQRVIDTVSGVSRVANSAQSIATTALNNTKLVQVVGGQIHVGREQGGNVLTVSNKDGGKRYLNGVQNATLSASSSDAVTGQQLFATNQKVDATSRTLATGNAITAANMASAKGNLALAMGQAAKADGVAALSLGHSAVAVGENTIALGSAAGASGTFAVALGGNAKATHANSVALGEKSVTTGEKQVSVGSAAFKRKIVNLDDGLISAGSSEAVTGNQLFNEKERVNGLIKQASVSGNMYIGAENTGDVLTVSNKDGVKRYIRGVQNATLSANSNEAVTGQQLFATNTTLSTVQTTANQAKVTADLGLSKADALGRLISGGPTGAIQLGAQNTGSQLSVRNQHGWRRVVTGLHNADLSAGSTEAVTGQQLFETNNSVATAQAAADAASGKADALSGLVSQVTPNGNLRLGGENTGAALDVRNKAGTSRVVDGVAAGRIATDSDEAISGKQLYATEARINTVIKTAVDAQTVANRAEGKADVLGGLVKQESASGNMRLGGENTGGVLDVRNKSGAGRSLTGLADGVISATSTEAVTGKQLQATHDRLATAQSRADAAHAGATAAQTTANQAKAKADATGNAVATSAVIEDRNRATATGNLAMAMGQAAKANGVAAFAMGHSAVASGNNAVSVGSASAASAKSAVALGGNAKAKHENSVALGEGSETTGINEVSVGNAATDLKRRIVNVDDARLTDSSTDAVTGKQLFATNEKVEANEGVLAGHTRDLAAQSGRIADNRRDLDALRSEFEDFDPDLDGVVKFAADGSVDIAGGKLRGVAAGDISSPTSTDAVNGGQLFATHQRIEALEDNSRFFKLGIDGESEDARAGALAVAIGDSAQASIKSEGGTAIGSFAKALGFNSVALGRGAAVSETAAAGFALGASARVDSQGGVAIGGQAWASAANSVALGYGSRADQPDTVSVGSTSLQRRITNVADGRAATDAATIGQVAASVSALGGDAHIDADGNIIAPTYNVQGGTQNNVGDALAALDSAVVTADSRVDNLEGKLRSAFQDGPSVRADGQNQLVLAGANGSVLTNLADGRIAAGSRDAVTGSQLFEAKQEIVRNRNDLNDLRGERDGLLSRGLMAAEQGNVIDFGGARLTGVADGVISANSRDVVSGRQLFEFGGRLSEVERQNQFVSVGVDELSERSKAELFGVAIGESAEAGASGKNGATAIGSFSRALAVRSIALGVSAYVAEAADDGFAVGAGANVFSRKSMAIGNASRVVAGLEYSVALGHDSIATDSYVVSVGASEFQRRIVNVANGRNATDAATVGQLRGALATLGGDVDANGNIIDPTFNVQGAQQSTLNEALSSLDSAVVTNTTRTERVESQLRAVFQDSPAVRNDGLNQLTFAGANGMVLSNVANGAIAAGSRDAVNGGQLHSMQQQLNGRMDGLEQRIDGQPQAPQSRALTVAAVDSAASSTPAATPAADEPTTPPPSSGDNKVVADAGNAPKSSPQPQADAPKPEAPTPQVDTAELEKMLARANEYSDGISREVDRRLDKMDKRFNRMAAMSSAQSAMAMNTAGLNTYNRLGAGVGYSEGESAMAVGYQRVLNDKGSATFSLNGAFTNSGERSMGVGVGIGW
ncbi:ESPR-type extended signal peptide-containing protein [Isoptericola jiangsuensis]|uniref:ESPR-type extended signal peptide-containing protein n=1 Tax=Isoptericola jiangsuensis TaxID=548579 RepID=UPI00386E2B18